MNYLYIGPATKENLNASVRKRVPWKIIDKHLSSSDAQRLKDAFPNPVGANCWAMRNTDKFRKLWDEMNAGDIVLLKENGPHIKSFKFLCEIDYMVKSKTFGTEVWEKGENWELIYFFDTEIVDISMARLRKLIGHEQPTKPLMGFIRINPNRMNSWIEQYGSVRDFLNALSGIDAIEARPGTSPKKPTRSVVKEEPAIPERPEYLRELCSDIDALRKKANHQERAHESLVETLFKKLGYKPYVEIEHRPGRVDILIKKGHAPLFVVEVKRDWHLQWNKEDAVAQAYNYANRNGAKYVVVTNGDYYAFYDRQRGLSIEKNFVREFRILELNKDDLKFLDSIRRSQ